MNPGEGALIPSWTIKGDLAAFFVVLGLFVLSFPTWGFARYDEARAVAFAGSAMLGAWWIVGWSSGRVRRPFSSPLFLIQVALVCALVWGAAQRVLPGADGEPIALDRERARDSWNQLLAIVLFFGGVSTLVTRRIGAMRLAWLLGIASLAAAWIGLARYLLTHLPRANLPLFNPNHQAYFIIAGLPLYFAMLKQWNRLRFQRNDQAPPLTGPRFLYWSIGVLALIGWLVCYSRSSLVLGGVIFAGWALIEVIGSFYFGFEEEEHHFSAQLIILPAFAVIGFMTIVLGTAIPSDFAMRLSAGDVITANDRTKIWAAAWDGFTHMPLLGAGPGGASTVINEFLTSPITKYPVWVHNDYLQWLLELGIIGTLLVLALLACAGVAMAVQHHARIEAYNWRQRRVSRAAIAGVLILMAGAVLDFHLRIPLVAFQCMTLVALAFSDGPMMILRRRTAHL